MINNRHSIGKAISGVVVLTLASKLIGFFREIILSFFFGASGISDAYLISQTIPGTIFQFVGVGLMTCFIPVYFAVSHDSEDTIEYTNKILSLIFAFSSVVIAFVWSFTPSIIKAFAYGFSGETMYYAIWFTRIGTLSLYFSSMIYVFNSYLHAKNIFIITAFSAIPYSLALITAIICGARINIWLLSIGSLIAVGVQLLCLIPTVQKTGYKMKFYFDFHDRYIKMFLSLMGPVVVGVSVNEINTLVDRTVASQVAIGGISALTYANSLIQFVQGGLVQPISTVYYPKITEYVSTCNHVEARKVLSNAIEIILGMLIPVTFGFIFFSEPITRLLFRRGAFDETALLMTSIALRYYAVGICFVAIRELISRLYYANSNTKTPMINTSIGVGVNIVLNIFLSRFIGIAGVALATSISAMVTAVLLLYDTKTKIETGTIPICFLEVCKIIVCSIITGTVAFFAFTYLHSKELIALVLTFVIAVFCYIIMGSMFKLKIIIWARKLLGELHKS